MSIEKGCRVAVETCMGVRGNEKVVIVSDERTKNIGTEIRDIALEVTPHVKYFNINKYGKRPLDRLPRGIHTCAHDADVTFWTPHSKDGELETLRMPFLKAALNMGRHAHMVNINEEIIKDSMAVDYEEISEFTDKLYDKIKKADKIRVKNDLGTDITATFDKYRWVRSTGICHTKGQWANLPSGEMFKPPTNMEGEIVIDGSVGDHLGEKYRHSDLVKTPVTIEISTKERPQATSVSCENKELEKDIRGYISRHECSKYVGEVGFGTNIFLDKIVDNILQDEKYPGIHIAFGDPIADDTLADWSCPEHIDMILTKCNIWFDDDKIMEEGSYLIE
ncbi:MAG: aminopeptidase [Candidatus Saliniplasma sp.]